MPSRLLPADLAQVYAQALVAISRADDHLADDEGRVLQAKIDSRCESPMAFEDLLLADELAPESLAAMTTRHGPFRGSGVHPGELAEMIVLDAVEVLLAKGYIADTEAAEIIRFATALGCTHAQVRSMTKHLSPWLVQL